MATEPVPTREPDDDQRRVGTAVYLARYFTTFGFAPQVPPEMAPLTFACDLVLTRTLAGSIDILCMVDAETHPDRRFAMAPDELAAIGRACLKYAGRARRNRPPITIHVFEIGERLQPYAGIWSPGDVVLCRWTIDPSLNSVWTDASAYAQFLSTRAIESALATPHATADDLSRVIQIWRVAAATGRSTVWLTYVLVGALVAAFAWQLMSATDVTAGLVPSVRDLALAGGLNPNLVKTGDWSRILTAAFLHANPLHLGMNVLILAIAGRILEGYIGSAWFGVVYAVSAIAGSLVSLEVNPANMVSVGASGAIMGVVAAMLVCGFRFPPGPTRTRLQVIGLQVLIPSLLPVFNAISTTGLRVDLGAHVGGALGGGFVGLVILQVWPPTDVVPRLRSVVAALGIAALVVAAPTLRAAWRMRQVAVQLIPEADVPISDVGQRYQGAKLVAKYPHDPRARLFHAMVLTESNHLDSAEAELRAGLAETEAFRSGLLPSVEAQLHARLAMVLLLQDRPDDAMAAAAPVCRSDGSQQREARQALSKLYLCH